MNRLEDFEWVEQGFDRFAFQHKTHQLSLAAITNFHGWNVTVRIPPDGTMYIASQVPIFEAAQLVAMLYVHQHIGDYLDAHSYSERTPSPRPETIPEGVFKVDRVRP